MKNRNNSDVVRTLVAYIPPYQRVECSNDIDEKCDCGFFATFGDAEVRFDRE